MRLDHPDLHTEIHRLRERELREDAAPRRIPAPPNDPRRALPAVLGGWLRAMADRLDPGTGLERALRPDPGSRETAA